MNIPSSPTIPPTSSHPLEPVEDSEPEREVTMEDAHEVHDPQAISTASIQDSIIQNVQSDDELPPLPPPSSSSPSCNFQISRGPTPIVRYLLYGGPGGIFRDANTSLLQHTQARSSQYAPSTPLTPGLVHGAGASPVSDVFFFLYFILSCHLIFLLDI